MSRVYRTQSRPQRISPTTVGRSQTESAKLPSPAEIVAAAKEEAATILASAREESDALVEAARAEAERVTAEAIQAGRNEGYLDGHAEGALQTESLIEEANAALELARMAYARMLAEAEPRLLALVVEVSRRVLMEAFTSDPEVILDLIRKGLDALKDEREFSLRVPPSLVSMLEGQAPTLGREVGAKSIEVVGDPEVSGGAVILTPHGYVDVTIESQIRNITTALAESRKKAIGMETR